MRMNTQRILAVLLSLVLLLALAPAGWAEGGDGNTGGDNTGGGEVPILSAPMPATGVNLDPGANTVTINLVPSDKIGTKFESDIVKAKIVADLYLVAAAVKDENYDTYHYEFVGNAPVVIADASVFQDSLEDDPDPEKQNQYDTMLRTFSPLAQAFAKSIFTYEGLDTGAYPTKTATATGTTIKVEGLDPGLYMLVLHGSDLAQKAEDEDEAYVTTMTKAGGGQYNEYGSADTDIIATRAYSDDYEFLFEPQMITMPTRLDDEGNQQYNTAYGTKWSNELTIVAKPDWKPRNGILKITKTLTNYADLSKDGTFEPMTFSFSVVGVDKDGNIVYQKEVALSVDSPVSEKEVITLKDIPIGTMVTVTETYSGAHATGSTGPQTVEILAPTETTGEDGSTTTVTANVSFTNTNNDTHRGGHGIENKFTFNKETGGWGWVATGGDGPNPESEVN